jgi:hypothetical protein
MKKYINTYSLIGSIASFLMFYIDVAYPGVYDYDLIPAHFSHKTGNMVFSYLIYFMDKYLGKAIVMACLLFFSGFLFFVSFNWPEIIDWFKRKK